MNIKKIVILLIIALFFSSIIYFKYNKEENTAKEYYILQVGAYSNYDNVVKNTRELENYIVYEENNLYKIFIGITSDTEIYNKLVTTYASNLSTFKKTVKINNEEIENKINNFDKVIKNTDDKTNLNIIIKEELKILEKFLNKTN